MKDNMRGFTLLELLVVIFLFSMIMAVVGISVSSGTDSSTLKSSARQLIALVRNLRTKAITESVVAGITVDSSNNSYRTSPGSEMISLPESLDVQIKSSARNANVPSNSLLFYPDGSASGGAISLESSVGSMVIEVNWLTGEVALQSSSDSLTGVDQ